MSLWRRFLCGLLDHRAAGVDPALDSSTRCDRCGAWFNPAQQDRARAEEQAHGF